MLSEEYEELQVLLKQMTFQKTGQEWMKVERQEGDYVIKSGGKLAILNGLIINGKDKRLRTPFGDCKAPNFVKDSEGGMGRWSGFSWRLEEGEPLGGEAAFVSLSLGIIHDLNRAFIYFKAKKIEGGVLVDRADSVVYFDPPDG